MEKENKLQQCLVSEFVDRENNREATGMENVAAARLPYEAPAMEVIEVQTERGYAGSIDPWEPAGW